MPVGLSAALIAAIEQFTAQKKERERQVKVLQERAAAGGVRGLAAKNELDQLESADETAMNKMELTLDAAKRKASKTSGEAALLEAKKREEEEKRRALEASRNKLKAKAALWEGK